MSFVCIDLILCVCPSFPFGIEGGIWDVIVFIPDHCLPVYFAFRLIVCFLHQKRYIGTVYRQHLQSIDLSKT